MSNWIHEFCKRDELKFSPKYLFEHIRNVGLCSATFIFGKGLLGFNSEFFELNYFFIALGVTVVLFSIFLLLINVQQLVIAVGSEIDSVVSKSKKFIIAIVFSFVIYGSIAGVLIQNNLI